MLFCALFHIFDLMDVWILIVAIFVCFFTQFR
jgi:hypothetical protein